MPLFLDRTSPAGNAPFPERSHFGPGSVDRSDCSQPVVTVGLVNNMKDGALEATERQFMSLLDAASQGLVIRLRFYRLPGVSRDTADTPYTKRYSDIETLWDEEIDGLIVTGREPSTARLEDEPYWESFVRLLTWAQDHTRSTIWSCLAAHAAVLHMDGIPRVRSTFKHCGLFDCDVLSDHPMTAGAPPRFRLPHSRWNGLEEMQLVEHGYEILTRSERVGVDAFVRRTRSLFLFFQGHPEYEANTLLLEYRRDVARYLRGEALSYPSLPQGYFDNETMAALQDVGREARLFPREELFREVSSILSKTQLDKSWHSTAVSIYKNWLHHLLSEKTWPLDEPAGIVTHTPPPESEDCCVID